jgi:uracil phosphoribosyltransferase
LEKIREAHPDVFVTVGMVDEVMTEDGVVQPGLGDAGNRLYGTTPLVDMDDDDENLLHHSKRKRSDAGV